ncbi:GNAT family N-acetyltransferase [Actinoplanes oblitus]|uniref:GNAT family N-acetyltransferase n=1 Tax=Actinoplanes oblitus TaxID=3040509 RepID=A0ABY8WE64_9ACTN|nr:GNAT family N-acetyltransferase [Actinoplanes oblitus]WIM96161.1 GNAT family N-acetyltransferase [Actinoplanes oblitus]
MADFSIRPAEPDDAAAVVALSATVHPYLVRGVARTRLMIAEPPPGEDWAAFVAERDGKVAGWVSAYRNARTAEPDFGQISLLQVHPAARGRGIGSALFAAAAGHLRAAGIRRAAATATPEALPFARRRGFEPLRELRYSVLDLAPPAGPGAAASERADLAARAGLGAAASERVDPPAPVGLGAAASRRGDLAAPAGPGAAASERADPPAPDASRGPTPGKADATLDDVRLISLRETTPEVLYAADVAAAADEPGDVPPQPPSFTTWCYDVWQNPGLDHEISTAALIAGEIVAFSLLVRDGDRVWSDMTATAPAHRGRGLARLVKTVALTRAAAAGVARAFTSNDETNLPMLAVNTRLGYRPVATQFSCVGPLG